MRIVLTVGNLFGLHEGDILTAGNSPAYVEAVATTIAADLRKLDPKDGADDSRQLTKQFKPTTSRSTTT